MIVINSASKAGVALETKLRQVCLDNQKICQIPVISWPGQVRPTCLNADKNLSAETNLQRRRRPASEHDFLRTTNKNCFSCDKPVSQFCKTWVFFASHFTFPHDLCSAVLPHSHIIMNPSYPFYFNIDPDQTNLNEAQGRYRPGQLFWRWNQSENINKRSWAWSARICTREARRMILWASLAAFTLRT